MKIHVYTEAGVYFMEETSLWKAANKVASHLHENQLIQVKRDTNVWSQDGTVVLTAYLNPRHIVALEEPLPVGAEEPF